VSLDVLKDLLGLIGSIVMIVPFFRDFVQRRSADRLRGLLRIFRPFRRTIETALDAQKTKSEQASSADLACMLIGIGLLIASFAVSFYVSAHTANG
jgi:uncharacterized membrane protein